MTQPEPTPDERLELLARFLGVPVSEIWSWQIRWSENYPGVAEVEVILRRSQS